MIRPAEVADANRIAEIHIIGWRAAYRGIVSDRFLFTNLSVGNSILRVTKAIIDKSEETYVYEENEIIKGILTIGKSRSEDKKNAFELWGIYVEPFMKRQGIGRKLVEYCEEEAIKKNYKEIILWVLKDNLDSRYFYEKMGYLVEGKEIFLDNINAYEIRYSKTIG